MDELLKRLNRYTRQCLTERTDPDFADAVEEMKNTLMAFGANAYRYASIAFEHEIEIGKLKSELEDCRNELCLKCGGYRSIEAFVCEGCRWKA